MVEVPSIRLLRPLFARVICVPASSAPVERIFSQSGMIMSERRAAEHACPILFLRHWCSLNAMHIVGRWRFHRELNESSDYVTKLTMLYKYCLFASRFISVMMTAI